MEAEVESLPQCSGDGGRAAWFAWALQWLCNGVACSSLFSNRVDGGDGLPSICFHSSVRHGLPLFSMAGVPLAISIEVQWNLWIPLI